jgi:hypothetical protein
VAGPKSYTAVGGGGPNPPHGEDYFDRIVNVHWPKRGGPTFEEPEQALVVTDFDAGTAVALDTGETFSGTLCGASGRLASEDGTFTTRFTVLSRGLVVYGKPANGDACFMACVDGTTIMRGTHSPISGVEPSIIWDTVYTATGGSTCGLSFGGGAFFILTQTPDDDIIRCAISTNGTSFSGGGNPFAGVPTDDITRGRQSGSVASNGGGLFAATGEVTRIPNYFLEDNSIVSGDDAMMWGSSSDGASWSTGYSSDEITNPGQFASGTLLGSSQCSAMATVAGGNGIFVSVATQRTKFFWFSSGIPLRTYYVTRATAAAAVSSDGSFWSTIPLPGAIEANYVLVQAGDHPGNVNSQSQSDAVAFIQTGEIKSDISGLPPVPTGYFVMTANGAHKDSIIDGGCWRGDGNSWSRVLSGGTPFGHVSAIAKDLDQTTIVRI